MKKAAFLSLCTVFLLLFSSCGTNKGLEGYWLANDGTSFSFSADGRANLNNTPLSYYVYDKNYLSINSDGVATEFKFDIQGNVLTLTHLGDNAQFVFYKGEAEQTSIRDRLASEQKQKAEQQAKSEQISSINMKISKATSDIASLESAINTCEAEISNRQSYIQDEYQMIEDITQEISDVTTGFYNNKIEKIAQLQERIALRHDNISRYQEEISMLHKDIEIYQQNINTLNSELDALYRELDNLSGTDTSN